MLIEGISHAEAARSATPGLPASQPDVRWYAAYTCAHHEKQVSRQLAERRIDCFLPLYRSVRRWKDRRKEVQLALFPGYVFVHIGAQERLRVLQIPRVVRFVSFSGRPSPLDDNEIESLRNGVTNGVWAEPHPYLKAGRRVRVTRGPLAGAEGILVRKKDKFRVVISIHIIMRSVAVEVDQADVEAC
jgi:transcription antitermination factor NusG